LWKLLKGCLNKKDEQINKNIALFFSLRMIKAHPHHRQRGKKVEGRSEAKKDGEKRGEAKLADPRPRQQLPPIAMKTLQREAQPARSKMAPAPEPKTKGAPATEDFTASEVDVANLLIQLSESSASSGTSQARAPRAPAGSVASYCSRSEDAPPAPVLAPGPAVLLGGCVDWEEDEEQEVAGTQRRVKRYRLIAEIYAATEEIGGRPGRKNKKW
jgi:hypothetical protein